jgi:SAM-dependent methyltransferase
MMAVSRMRRLFVHTPFDHVAFWRSRSAEPGWQSVMWRNPAYNECAHAHQWAVITRSLPRRRRAVLDLGCGTGRISRLLAAEFDRYVGVDLDRMVEQARRRNPDLAERYVVSTVQQYAYPPATFDLVLSMACLSSACAAPELPAVAEAIVRTTRPGGRIVLLDAFHRAPALVRTCRIAPGEVVAIFTALGTRLVEWDGMHCFPFRLVLAQRQLARLPGLTRAGYRVGEALLRVAPRRLADYSVIVLDRP